MQEVFSVVFPILVDGISEGGADMGRACQTNTSHYAEGGSKATCCCQCDKP